MTDPLRYTVLIIDFPGACTLRERLLPTGASVHVVSSAAALIWARVKKIDAAFISFDDASTKLCEQLAGLGVRPIIVSADETTGASLASSSGRTLLGARPARQMEASRSYLH